MMAKVQPEAFSLQQAAALLSVNVMTVRRWIKKGDVVAFRAGRKLWRIPLSELRKLKQIREQ